MSEWRHRGYVEDSDEEGGDLTSNSAQDVEERVTNHGLELAKFHDQEDTLRRGPKSVQQAQDEQGPEEAQAALKPSSEPTEQPAPLESFDDHVFQPPQNLASQIAESEEHIPQWFTASRLSSNGSPLTSPSSDTDNGASASPEEGELPHRTEETSPHRAIVEIQGAPQRRNLRSRTFAQLHPYLLDMQQHKEQMRARGLKPIRVVTEQEQESGETHGDVEEPENAVEPRDSGGSSSQETVDSQLSSQPVLKPTSMPYFFRDDDDLPDIDALFGRNVQGGLQLGFKRRKTYTGRDRAIEGPNQTEIFDIPPSPSVSATSSLLPSRPESAGKTRTAIFRMPRGVSPACLPTPVMSSETGRPFKPVVETLTDSHIELHAASMKPRGSTPRRAASISSAASTSCVSEVDESEQIRWAKKRIKGVLPASWLRLDRQAQTDRVRVEVSPGSSSPSPVKSPPQRRGVAQPRRTQRSPAPRSSSPTDRPETIYISDAESDVQRPVSPMVLDVEEEDRIDAMLPSVPRRPFTGRQRKRQTKLPFDALEKPVKSHLRRSAPQRKSAPRLGILDALVSPTATALPPFLRVAARKVRKRRDKATLKMLRQPCVTGEKAKQNRVQSRRKNRQPLAERTADHQQVRSLHGDNTPTRQPSFNHSQASNLRSHKTAPQIQTARRPLLERTANDQQFRALRGGNQTAQRLPYKNVQPSGHGLSAAKTTSRVQRTRRSRKRRPRRLDVETGEYRQPTEEPIIIPEDAPSEAAGRGGLLMGLRPFGTKYTWNFDVVPLQLGTFFHETTFIGSGGLKNALNLTARNLEILSGYTTIRRASSDFRWGPYTEDVASELEIVFHEVQESFHEGAASGVTATQILRLVVEYITQSLSFLDPIDARSCVVTVLKLCRALLDAVVSQSVSHELLPPLSYLLVIADQAYQIAIQEDVGSSIQEEARQLVTHISAALLRVAIIEDNSYIRKFLADNTCPGIRDRGIRDNDGTINSIFITAHVLTQARHAESGFWTVVDELLMELLSDPLDHIDRLELAWDRIFKVLPSLEFDTTGVLNVGRRFQQPVSESWNAVRYMLSRLFTVYSSQGQQRQGLTLNEYIRANLARVHHLIQAWGWRKCEPIIGVIFDFFARNALGPLRQEETRGLPRFLYDLDQDPALIIEPEDRSFTIFLKIVGTGIKNMRLAYTTKKIRSIAWRMIPNHGRTYPKEEEIRQEDLDALRNHHSLLCTLYWACPPDSRPRLDLIRNLVDHSTSHREACLVNIRAWANLAHFQISADEPSASLQPFGEWLSDILQHSMVQHNLAKTEAEDHFELSKAASVGVISRQLVYTTITKNQRQVEAALSDALLSTKEVLKAARNEEAASVFLEAAGISNVFKMFDSSNTRLSKVICQTLDVYVQYMADYMQKRPSTDQYQESEESQDYGDFPALEDLAAGSESPRAAGTLVDTLVEPLAQLLSSCFGSETAPDETLLVRVVDTWSMLASCLVNLGRKTWSNFVDDYSPLSWHQLRDTDQKRKFGAYLMSSMLKLDHCSYLENPEIFHLELLSSLVERESMLKYQHVLLSSILNVDAESHLLVNMPFKARDGRRKYEISLSDLRERRLSVISSILANMRQSFEEAIHNRPHDLLQLRRDYSTLLKHMMTKMKQNYQELVRGSDIRGAYVEFVHKVVEFLQQYTFDICPVDKFFTDSAAFPLPAKDPTYVVARLRSYAPKLADARSQKQLAVFVRTISERAAADNQQPYLVGQLHAAMRNTFEIGDPTRPSLRRVLLEGIFPAYIKQAFSAPCGWLLARPILQASKPALSELLYDMSISHGASVASVVQMTTTILATMRDSTDVLIDHAGLLDEPSSLCVLQDIFHTVTAALALVDYIQRSKASASLAGILIQYFRSFALFVAATLLGHEDAPAPPSFDPPASPSMEQPAFTSLQDFCNRELQQASSKAWVKHGDQYYIVRGSMSEVIVDLGNVETEKRELIGAIEEFLGALSTEQDLVHEAVSGGFHGVLVV